MESSLIELSKYRFESAKSDLNAAQLLYNANKFKASVNRSYYAIFHALRSVLALDEFDSSKHSGIISYFNYNYVKTGKFDRNISKLVSTAYRLREKADYQDFYIVTGQEASEQISKAEQVIEMVENYLDKKYENDI